MLMGVLGMATSILFSSFSDRWELPWRTQNVVKRVSSGRASTDCVVYTATAGPDGGAAAGPESSEGRLRRGAESRAAKPTSSGANGSDARTSALG